MRSTDCLKYNIMPFSQFKQQFFKACVIYNPQILHNLQHCNQYNNTEFVQSFLRR